MLGHVPECGEQFNFIRAGHELDRPGLGAGLLKILGEKQHLAALRVGVEHGDADDLGGERPEIELLPDFGALGFAGGFVGDLFGLAEQVFLLRLVKMFERQRGSLDVKNNGGHVEINRQVAKDAKKIFQICFLPPVSAVGDDVRSL